MKRCLSRLAGMVVAVSLIGCHPVPKDAGFGEVRQIVSDRTGQKVHWNSGGEADRAVAVSVRGLLADDLTVEEAVQIALLNNQDLQAVYEDLGVAQANLVQAGLLRNPVFEASAGIPINGGQADLTFGVAMDFVELLFIPLRQKAATAQFESTKFAVADAVVDLASRTQEAYYRLQSQEAMLEMLRQVSETTGASSAVAQRLREAGNITELDRDEEQAEHEHAKVELAVAEAAVAADRERLNVLMGLWGNDTQWRVPARLPEVPAQEMDTSHAETRAISRSLDLAVQREAVLATAKRLGVADATAWFTDAQVGAEATRDDGEWDVGPKISLPIPLLDQGQARVALAQAELRRSRAKYTATAVRVRSSMRVAVQQLAASRDRAIFYKSVLLPLRQRIVDQAQLHYNAMQIGASQLLDVRRRQIEAGGDFIQAQRDYWLARVRIEAILAGHIPVIEIDPQFPAGVTGTDRVAGQEGVH